MAPARLVVLSFFVAVLLLVLLSRTSSHPSPNTPQFFRRSVPIPHDTTNAATKNDNLYDDDDDRIHRREHCYTFGCPRYPPELDKVIHQVLSDVYLSKTHDNNNRGQQQTQNDDDRIRRFGTSTMAMLSQMGKSHGENQDRAVLIQPFIFASDDDDKSGESLMKRMQALLQPTTNDNFLGTSSSSPFLMGLFDGHGVQGHIVADYVCQELPKRLAETLHALIFQDKDHIPNDALSLEERIIQALQQTFVNVDIDAPPNALKGGTTATVTFGWGNKLYIANAGDSQTVLVAVDHPSTGNNNNTLDNGNGKPKIGLETSIVFTTQRDTANIASERERIQKLGGNVRTNQNNMAHVIVYSDVTHEHVMLAPSRTIGDWEWKPIGVTAEPIVRVIDLADFNNKKKNLFLMAASDGLWDVRRREFYARQFAESFYGGPTNHGTIQPLHRLWEVIQMVTPKNGYMDDQTAIIMRL
jgi:serine/threonine protein phosphatase PrpC